MCYAATRQVNKRANERETLCCANHRLICVLINSKFIKFWAMSLFSKMLSRQLQSCCHGCGFHPTIIHTPILWLRQWLEGGPLILPKCIKYAFFELCFSLLANMDENSLKCSKNWNLNTKFYFLGFSQLIYFLHFSSSWWISSPVSVKNIQMDFFVLLISSTNQKRHIWCHCRTLVD